MKYIFRNIRFSQLSLLLLPTILRIIESKLRLKIPVGFLLGNTYTIYIVESSRNVMAHGDAREGKRRKNCPMECVASTLHTTTEHGVSSIFTADAHTSAASSRLNWRPRRFKWTRPSRRKTKSGFCACAIIFQTQYICICTWIVPIRFEKSTEICQQTAWAE